MTCKKVSFADESAANFYIDKLKKTSDRKLIPVRAYLCEKCLTWHLTKIESPESAREKQMQRQIDNLISKNNHLLKEVARLTEKINNQKSQLRQR